MEVGSPEWIEASLAKLDDLERKHGEHETLLDSARDPLTIKQHSDALERLDAEIKALYSQLEEFAEDDEDAEPEAPIADSVAPRVTQSDDELSSPHPMAYEAPPKPAAAATAAAAFAASAPLISPPSAPIEASPASEFGSADPFTAAPAAFDDADLKVKGGGGKWIALGLVVAVGVGVGGFFAWQSTQVKDDKPEPPPAIVIEAVEVPEDTEAPNSAKGADATISPTAKGSEGDTTKKKVEPKKKKPFKLKAGDDPLG